MKGVFAPREAPTTKNKTNTCHKRIDKNSDFEIHVAKKNPIVRCLAKWLSVGSNHDLVKIYFVLFVFYLTCNISIRLAPFSLAPFDSF